MWVWVWVWMVVDCVVARNRQRMHGYTIAVCTLESGSECVRTFPTAKDVHP